MYAAKADGPRHCRRKLFTLCIQVRNKLGKRAVNMRERTGKLTDLAHSNAWRTRVGKVNDTRNGQILSFGNLTKNSVWDSRTTNGGMRNCAYHFLNVCKADDFCASTKRGNGAACRVSERHSIFKSAGPKSWSPSFRWPRLSGCWQTVRGRRRTRGRTTRETSRICDGERLPVRGGVADQTTEPEPSFGQATWKTDVPEPGPIRNRHDPASLGICTLTRIPEQRRPDGPDIDCRDERPW